MAIKSLVTDSTEVRRRKWARGAGKRPLRLAGSAVTTCLECGERFPDTSGGHWPGQCLLVLRRLLRRLESALPKEPREPFNEREMRVACASAARRAVIRDRIRRIERRIGSYDMDGAGMECIKFAPASLGVNPEDLP